MTDLNTQMTTEAMMQAEIERLRALIVTQSEVHRDHVRGLTAQHEKEREFYGNAAQDFRIRAEKAERELAEHRAQTDALIAAAYEDAAKEADKAHEQNEYQWKTRAYPRAISCETVAERIRDCVPADAKAALETRDRAMRNEGIKQAATAAWDVPTGYCTAKRINMTILSLIEKEPEGKGDE
ncbi:hypothetical protein D2T31_11860 [Sinirhodobacter populi]|uniref:Uncharacterized protein n=1 Tax=Paenirhodobacter populi TaxID=2306993 RepID=A0A443K7U3_9RHOB|nr:hypothetical protein [Sinirhodobacter populi]RWR28802.1 hypothetical protein D2T31_11860 [Sinirhodobacter populi]